MQSLQIAAGTERGYLRLADAMAEANGEVPAGGGEDGAPLVTRRVATRAVAGFRFQRCGGGKRIIRRQSHGRNG